MARFRFPLLCLTAALLGLAGCAISPEAELDRADYWERADATDAVYQRGPKAQQMLHRDISRCVTEIRELDRLSALRHAVPANSKANGVPADPETPEGEIAQWETPDREDMLHYEHLPYQDFETCMQHGGWVRVEHVPYDVAKTSREDYIEAITGQRYRTKTGANELTFGDKGEWEDLNK
jgi:hypothetical protein